MTMGSLFSGIGGLELGLEWAGLGPVVWQVEQDEFCRAVLAKHWPHVDRSVSDVRAVATSALPRTRGIVGGFPCQDVSGAGEGAGLAGARSGLWFVMRDIIAARRPEFVVVENVASGKKRWLCQVRTDLQALGYRARAVQISAADVGAPHLRERIFVLGLADPWSSGCEGGTEAQAAESDPGWCGDRTMGDARSAGLEERQGERDHDGPQFAAPERAGTLAAAHGLRRLQPQGGELDERDAREMGKPAGEGRGCWSRHAIAEPGRVGVAADAGGREAQSGMGGVPHGLSVRVDGHRWPAPRGAEQYAWEPPRTVQGKQPNRIARLKALGNAVVPWCAYVAGLALVEWRAELFGAEAAA